MAAAVPTEDAATVLEQFTHDVANVPAEISHLLEEIQAKDQVIGECRATIAQRDNSLQKFVKANGFGHVKHPKEDLWTKQVASAFEKAQGLQEEKVGLANKAAFLLDRQVKRLDRKIVDLEADGLLAHDPDLPSLLQESRANLVGPNINPNSNSATSTGVSTPMYHAPRGSVPPHQQQPYPMSVAANSSVPQVPTAGSGNIANAAMARMIHQAQMNRDTHASNAAMAPAPNQPPAPVAGMQMQPLVQSSSAQSAQQGGPAARESSTGAVENKRKRPHGSLGALPGVPTSGLARHSSLGPSGVTPKAGTPSGGGAGRSGSAGPRLKKPNAASVRGSTPLSAGGAARKKGTPVAGSSTGAAAGPAPAKGGKPKKKKRRLNGVGKGDTPSEMGDEESGSQSVQGAAASDGGEQEAAGKKRGVREGSNTSKGRGGGAAGRRAGSQKASKKQGPASKDGAASSGSAAPEGDPMEIDGEENDKAAVRASRERVRASDDEEAEEEEEEEEEAEEEEEEEADGAYDDDGDDRLYCVCQSVSHGNMVACDNDNCRFEWFHMPCVGMTHEPKGRWLCHECRKLPANQLKLAR